MKVELSAKAAEIVACAQPLLTAGGYNIFSHADISEAVHISKTSIRHHFASLDLSARLTVDLERGVSRGTFTLDGTPEAEAKTFMATVHVACALRARGDRAARHCTFDDEIGASLKDIPWTTTSSISFANYSTNW